jgi:hypothetical protein
MLTRCDGKRGISQSNERPIAPVWEVFHTWGDCFYWQGLMRDMKVALQLKWRGWRPTVMCGTSEWFVMVRYNPLVFDARISLKCRCRNYLAYGQA